MAERHREPKHEPGQVRLSLLQPSLPPSLLPASSASHVIGNAVLVVASVPLIFTVAETGVDGLWAKHGGRGVGE